MREWLTTVLKRIVDGTLLPASYYAALDCDAALDGRAKNGKFDLAWVGAFNEIGQASKSTEVEAELRTLAEDIRREGFLAVSRATNQHEIACYVSDDLDLIVRARLLGLKDPFVDGLWYDYERGAFPVPLTRAA